MIEAANRAARPVISEVDHELIFANGPTRGNRAPCFVAADCH